MGNLTTKFFLIICSLFLYCGHIHTGIAQELHLYSYPKEAPKDAHYQVWVNQQECFVYGMPIAGMASFGTTEQVRVEVKPNFEFKKVVIRPKSLQIQPQIIEGVITFEMPKNTKAILECDDRMYKPLYVFSQEKINPPALKQETDLIYEAGKYHKIGVKALKDNQRVWIQAGAIVEGNFLIENADNVHIFGHGIIDNRHQEKANGFHAVKWKKATNGSLKNVHVIGSARWSTSFWGCENMHLDDTRIIGWRPTDDGIDLVGSQNVEVENAFIRTKDDCIAIKAKAFDRSGASTPEQYLTAVPADQAGCENVRNIHIHSSTLWNAEWGNAIEIGFETTTDVMENMTFENIDIIRVEANGGVFTIHNGDRALVSNVLYKDIRIEEAYGFLCHFQIMHSHYSKDTIRGNGRNIRFENVSVLEGVPLNSLITGLNSEHTYEGIHFKNLYIHGKKIRNLSEGGFYTEFTKDITFE